MVELIKWWNNSTVRDILRYFSNPNIHSKPSHFYDGRRNLSDVLDLYSENHKKYFTWFQWYTWIYSDKLIRNGLRCLFGITLWKIKSALPPGTNQFSWHPNLFGLAIILYTEAYWVKRSFNPYYLRSLFGLGWTGRNRLHVLLSALASYSSYYGLYSIWVTKNMNNKPHFTSWHGQVGLASMTGWSK